MVIACNLKKEEDSYYIQCHVPKKTLITEAWDGQQ